MPRRQASKISPHVGHRAPGPAPGGRRSRPCPWPCARLTLPPGAHDHAARPARRPIVARPRAARAPSGSRTRNRCTPERGVRSTGTHSNARPRRARRSRPARTGRPGRPGPAARRPCRRRAGGGPGRVDAVLEAHELGRSASAVSALSSRWVTRPAEPFTTIPASTNAAAGPPPGQARSAPQAASRGSSACDPDQGRPATGTARSRPGSAWSRRRWSGSARRRPPRRPPAPAGAAAAAAPGRGDQAGQGQQHQQRHRGGRRQAALQRVEAHVAHQRGAVSRGSPT